MHSTTLTLLASLLPLTLAQYNYGSSDPTTTAVKAAAASATSSSNSAVHTVKVGDGGLTFSPSVINATVGQVVEFHFYPTKHSIAQSNFSNPCIPLTNNASFFTGPITTTSGVNPEVFSITVNDTKAIWFYCANPGHCQKGMSGVINPPADGSKTLETYIKNAANVTNTVAPAQVKGFSISQASSTNTSSSTESSTSSAPTSSNTKSAGVESFGGVRWVLMAGTAVMAGAFGGLIV